MQSLSGGNQQKVSLTRPFLRGRRQGDPGRGADPGRRRRRALRHLRRAAREGERGRGHDRQVERSARARRALRPRRRDVARADRRRDPRRRARASAGSSRRSSARGASARAARRPRAPARSRRERSRRFSGALPLVLMTLLIVALGAYAAVRQDAFLTSYNLNNLLLADDAARARLDRPDVRAARRRLRRLGRRR